MIGYTAPTSPDRNGNIPPLSAPPGPALAQASGSQTASSVIALAGNTTLVQITTMSNPVVGKWFGAGVVSPSVTATNFDFSIPANWTNYQVVPVSVQGIGGIGSIVGGYNAMNGLYPNLALFPIGGVATSIMTSQY